MFEAERSTNPMFGSTPFKLGLFAYAHDSAIALTTAPERWRARWDDIETMARMADTGGFEFLLPLARWKGFPGTAHSQMWNFENLTQAAALAAITKRIALFSTLHTPVVHPLLAAKALTTIDHVSHGRAGVNIVCGWNQRDFDMFGLKVSDHDDRYQQGEEWFELVKRILAGPSDEFDYDTRYYPGLKGVIGQPASIQQPYPATISAAYSDRGREFAVRHADFLLLGFVDEDGSTEEVDNITERSRTMGRMNPPGVLCMLAPYVRETRKEAEDFFQYFAIDSADEEAIDNFAGATRGQKAMVKKAYSRGEKVPMAAGGYPIIGTPEDIVDVLVRIHKQGYAGATFTLPHFIHDMPLIIDKVFPLMEQAGLRVASRSAAT